MSGTLRLRGATSGYSELQAPAVAADQTFVLPTAGGTLLTTDSPVAQLTLELGSASEPSLRFEGDTDTGLFSQGTNTLNLVTGGSSKVVLGADAHTIYAGTGATVRAVDIDSSGNVGVGTSSPSSLLTLGGADTTGSSQKITYKAGSADAASIEFVTEEGGVNRDAGIKLNVMQNTTPFTLLYAEGTNGGRVGIGTTSPSNKLNVIGDQQSVVFKSGTNEYNEMGVWTGTGDSVKAQIKTTTGLVSIGSRSNTDLAFNINDTERARIDSSGRLLVGTSTAINDAHTFKRTVNNSAFVIDNGATSGFVYGLQIRYSGYDPNNTGNNYLECYNLASSSLRASIRSNGGLANYQANNVNLSDRNTKKDISDAPDTWDCIKEWEIVNYRYKDQPDDADLNLGVIAQQVAESCPEVITVFEEAKDDQPEKLGVKEQQMMWMAIKALQEAQTRIETLEAEVATLKAQ